MLATKKRKEKKKKQKPGRKEKRSVVTKPGRLSMQMESKGTQGDGSRVESKVDEWNEVKEVAPQEGNAGRYLIDRWWVFEV